MTAGVKASNYASSPAVSLEHDNTSCTPKIFVDCPIPRGASRMGFGGSSCLLHANKSHHGDLNHCGGLVVWIPTDNPQLVPLRAIFCGRLMLSPLRGWVRLVLVKREA